MDFVESQMRATLNDFRCGFKILTASRATYWFNFWSGELLVSSNRVICHLLCWVLSIAFQPEADYKSALLRLSVVRFALCEKTFEIFNAIKASVTPKRAHSNAKYQAQLVCRCSKFVLSFWWFALERKSKKSVLSISALSLQLLAAPARCKSAWFMMQLTDRVERLPYMIDGKLGVTGLIVELFSFDCL